MAKILIPSFCNLTPHLETELEIIEQHLAKDDEVFYITCHHEMETCYHYYKPTFDECCYCRTRTKIGISLLSKNIHILSWPNDDSLHTNNKYVFSDANELRNFSIDGINYGLPVVSDLTTRLENDTFDTQKYSNIIESYINSSIYIHNAFNIIIDKLHPDIVYVFNGRFPVTYPVIITCIKRNICYYTHERSNSFGYYRIAYNTLPHDAHTAYDECMSLYANYSHTDAVREANSFYSLRRGSAPSTGLCYTAAQTLKKLPENFDTQKKNIVFFNSSEFEHNALPLAQNFGHYIYSSDSDMLSKLSITLANNTDIHIYCRVHPHLAGNDSDQVRALLDLSGKFKNLTIIPPTSDVDSYALMDNSSIVIVNISTMGAESSFWGKPVILVGYSILNELEGFYQPHSHAELIQLLRSDLKPLPRTGAVMYGLWLRKGGIAFKHFTQTGFHSGTFKGVDLHKAAIPRYKLARAAKILLDLMFFYGKEEASKSARKIAGKLAALLHIH